MNRLFSITVLLLLSVTAQAGHHRDHISERIDRVNISLDAIEQYLALYVATERLTPEETHLVENIGLFTDYMQAQGEYAQFLLALPFVPVDTIRPFFSQKKPEVDPPSLSYWLAVTLFYLSLLNETTPNTNVTSSIHQVMYAWMALDEVNWHIQDAIREEVYLDPDFGAPR